MPTMRAARFESYGPPSVLSVRDVDRRDLESGEVLVEVRASGINPSDIKNVAGAFGAPLPRTPGRDYAGVVVSGNAQKGVEVWGSGAGFGVARDGSHAQFIVVPSDWLSIKPTNLLMEEAATIGIPYLAAWTALVDAAQIREGDTVLITGVSGSVGRAAVQIAHWKKAKVIGASRSSVASEAESVIDISKMNLPSEVMARTGGKGADIVLDTVGGELFEPCLDSLRAGGRQVAITSAGNRRVTFDLVNFYHGQRCLIGIDVMKLTGADIARTFDSIRAGFEAGYLRPPSVRTWPLDSISQAYEMASKGGAAPKQVVLPHYRGD